MRMIYEEGDWVVIEATREYGVCSNNEKGGTEPMPVGKRFLVEVVRTWYDYETGRRYVAKTGDGRPMYFGDSGVKARMA